LYSILRVMAYLTLFASLLGYLAIVHPCIVHRRLLLLASLGFFVLSCMDPGGRRTCTFWWQVGGMVLVYKWLKSTRAYRVADTAGKEALELEFHERTASRVYSTVVHLNGFYVKVAQLAISMGHDTVPAPYLRALAPLRSGVPPRPFEVIEAVFRRDMGQDICEVFESFDEQPLGSASIGQVHVAVLRPEHGTSRDTQENRVVVKVQYPDVALLFEYDIANLLRLTSLVAPQHYDTTAQALDTHVEELDFRTEAANLSEVDEAMRGAGFVPGRVVLPKQCKGLVSRHILVMDYVDGVLLEDCAKTSGPEMLQALSDPAAIFRTLVEVHGHQLLIDGLANVDPHAGNVMLLRDGRLGLIDYGHCARFGLVERCLLARAVLGLVEGDVNAVVEAYDKLGHRVNDTHPCIVYRYASLHLDAWDLSPIDLGDGRVVQVQELILQHGETTKPSAILFAERLTAILRGNAHMLGIREACRIAPLWAGAARRVLSETGDRKSRATPKVDDAAFRLMSGSSGPPVPTYGTIP